MDQREALRQQIKELEKKARRLERAHNRSESSDKVNALLTHYAKACGSFGNGLVQLSERLNVGRITLVSWACKETLPQTQQRENLDHLYSQIFS